MDDAVVVVERPRDWHYDDEANHLADLLKESGADDQDLLEYVSMVLSRGLKRDAERTGEFRTYRPHGKIEMFVEVALDDFEQFLHPSLRKKP